MITSTANDRVKYIRSLVAHPRERHNERVFVVEGIRLVQAALEAGRTFMLVLYAPEQLATTAAGQQLLTTLAHQPYSYAATARVVAAASDTTTPQGVVAVTPWLDLPPQPTGMWLILDGVQDPGNVGTLLRSAEAVGVGGVWCSRGTVDVFSPKVVRAGMGAHFWLPIQQQLTWDELPPIIAQRPPTPIYATLANGTTAYTHVDWREPSVVILGNEAQGLSQQALAMATDTLVIPMVGRAESLNVAVAGSVIMFEMLRQKTESIG